MFNNIKLTIIGTAFAAANYRGTYGELTFSWEDCLLRMHDGQNCGGKVINPATDVSGDLAPLIARLTALEGAAVTSVVQNAAGDYVVTYFDGTVATLDDIDVPVLAIVDNGDGTQSLTIDGATFGPFATGPDDYSTVVDNGDGTSTVTYGDGSSATFPTGPQAVAVDNGDGTTTLTLADGTTVTVDTDGDADTFATSVDNGDGTATVTLADGSSILVPTGGPDADTTYAFVTNANGSFTATGTDGSVFTSPAGVVDTDTFAAIAGPIITFANGDTLDTAALAAESTLLRNASGTVTHTSDTGTAFTIPLDKTETDLDALAIPATQYGLSAGQLALAYNSGGVSDVAALLSGVKSRAYSVAPLSIKSTLHNSGLTGALNGTIGVRNKNGSLGTYSQRVADDDLVALLEENNTIVYLAADTYVVAKTLALPNGNYAGQVVTLQVLAAATGSIVRVTGAFSGTYRDSDTKQIKGRTDVTGTMEMRTGESAQLIWSGSTWSVAHTYWLHNGAGWHENEDGTFTAGYQTVLTAANGIPQQIALPVIVANPTALRVTITDFANDLVGAVQGPQTGSCIFSVHTLQALPNAFPISRILRQATNAVYPAADTVHVHIEGAMLDYAAL